MKRYMPTILLLIILLSLLSFSLVFFLQYGLGKSLSLVGYIFLVASILSFLFFLSIDPGYGWAISGNLYKNHIVMSVFIVLFIVSVVLIVVGHRVSELRNRTISEHRGTEQLVVTPVAATAYGESNQYFITLSRID